MTQYTSNSLNRDGDGKAKGTYTIEAVQFANDLKIPGEDIGTEGSRIPDGKLKDILPLHFQIALTIDTYKWHLLMTLCLQLGIHYTFATLNRP